MKWYENVYYLLMGLTYIFYFVIILTGWNKAPEYLARVNMISQMFIGVLLLWFFHPFQPYKYYPFHQTVAFTAGFFLMYSTILTKLMEYVQKWTAQETNPALRRVNQVISRIQLQ